ncbi:MAG: flagellar biosynthetic protein FliR [Leptospiraceae bacterium]|nr:flagellar biosynthetic protein FliR [Leptospiraceae bacterium]MDW7976491.1 flagellar biosynthetic protein FliR [Leptospiraceae bacterium]
MEPFFKGFWSLLLIFSRIMGIVFVLPVISSENIPYRFRVSIAVFLSFLFFPLVSFHLPKTSFENFYAYLLEFFTQFFIGFMIGFMILVIFSAFIMTGEFLSIQMGISFSEVLDPQSQVSLPIIGTLKNLLGILLFLTVDFELDGYYLPTYLHVIRALYYSFSALPTLQFDTQTLGGFLNSLDQAFGIMFLTSLKLGLPLVGILFITSVALGVINKASPQFNLLNLGLQFNIIVGLIVFILIIPVMISIMKDSFIIALQFLGEMFHDIPKVNR